MKSLLFTAGIAFALISLATPVVAQKSALDGHQFDGVMSDAALKTAKRTRRDWLDKNPIGAKEYWAAWDCKGKPCDSKWFAKLRAKAALITRTHQDPKPAIEDSDFRGSKED